MYTFETLPGLAQLFKHTNYSKATNFFYDIDKNTIKKVIDKGEETSVECLMLFKENIEPKWEDPANSVGGSFVLEIDMN